MRRWSAPWLDRGPIFSTYRAIFLGTMPLVLLVICFELTTPSGLLADRLEVPRGAGAFDISRLVMFISIGTMHILLCGVIAFLSLSTLQTRLARLDFRIFVVRAVVVPLFIISILFIFACLLDPKIYRISFARIIYVLGQIPEFSYQFDICTRNWWLRPVCPSGNLQTGFFGFALIASGWVASISVSADIGVSSFHHARTLTPERLFIAGKEMKDDINRYAVSLLLVLTSSSVATAAFQPVGLGVLGKGSANYQLYERAAQSASLFWPLAFTSIFLGIFLIPALSIMRKRSEALRLLDSNEISSSDYESFFAVREALPQSVRWMVMSGLPLFMSLVPRLAG